MSGCTTSLWKSSPPKLSNRQSPAPASPGSHRIRIGNTNGRVAIPRTGSVATHDTNNNTVTASGADSRTWYICGVAVTDAPSGTGPCTGHPTTRRVATAPVAASAAADG